MNVNKINTVLIYLTLLLSLTGCSPVKIPVSNIYTLESFGTHKYAGHSTHSILVSVPEALAGYQTEQMFYVQKPFELNAFVHNAWVSSPANMIYPLIIESLQKSRYFFAVASGPYVDKSEYRLDTQLIELQQNFLVKPSTIHLIVKAMVTHIADHRILASRVFHEQVNCPMDTPYGGVIAANRATKALTRALSEFVISEIKGDTGHS